MTKNKTFIIAEAGVNHNGKLELALQLCDAAKEAGADAVKFQTWKTEAIITRMVAQAEYQIENTGKTISQFDMLKALELSYSDFTKIKSYCDSIGILFLSTPDERESLDFLLELGMPAVKIGSGEITNIPFLRYAGSRKKPVILSTGMSSLAEVDVAYRTLKDAGASNITLLHCTTNYPCPMNAVNLTAMQTLHAAFKCPVGYSDHTVGYEVAIAAIALGASVIEKHFTLDVTMQGPDHAASTNPKDFTAMVQKIRNIEKALGIGIKLPSQSETKISEVVLKRIVAKKKISCGEKFLDDNITVKRSSDGVSASLWDTVIGLSAKKDFAEDEGIKL
ncbi:N-acetylneuraminate synthase [Treponema pedis]|uniref:N-acetylneuraminate synthase n=1 Tax=Treponema pedis TaxID=409322 RepID=UPI0003FB3469|nr:N-acetylneuraminate synthase [Treponema pedis]